MRKLFSIVFFLFAIYPSYSLQATSNEIASSMDGGQASDGGSEGWTIDVDLGGGYSEPSYTPEQHINIYEPEYSIPQEHINIYEPEYSMPQEHINIYEPEYYPIPQGPQPEPYYPQPTPQPQPAPQPTPRLPRIQSLPLVIIINQTPVVRIGQIITIRINVTNAAQPVTIFWRIDGLPWINGGTILRRIATRPGFIPITVIVKDANGLFSQRQITYVTVLKNPPTQPRPAVSGPVRVQPSIAKQQMQIKAKSHALNGLCFDTDFGTLRFTVNDTTVTGTYDYMGGSTITGKLQDNILLGKWQEPAKDGNPAMSGPFQFAFTEEWASFQGVWGHEGDDPLTGVWNGAKIPCPAPGQAQAAMQKKETLEQQQTNVIEEDLSNVPKIEEINKQEKPATESLPK